MEEGGWDQCFNSFFLFLFCFMSKEGEAVSVAEVGVEGAAPCCQVTSAPGMGEQSFGDAFKCAF